MKKAIIPLLSLFLVLFISLIAFYIQWKKELAQRLTGDAIRNFIEENKKTGNEYATVEDGSKLFSIGRIVSEDGMKALKPYIIEQGPDKNLYHIPLIDNSLRSIWGDLSIEVKRKRISESNFMFKQSYPPATANLLPKSNFSEIRIESHPKPWGYAQKTAKPDGSIKGGHLSGGKEAASISETESKLESEDMDKLKSLVTSLKTRPLREFTPPDQKSEGYSVVIITMDGDSEMKAYAKDGECFEHKEIQSIWDLLSKYKVGGW